jgi:hypothetical protein
MTTDTVAPATLTFRWHFWASVTNRSLQSSWIEDAFYNRTDQELLFIFKESNGKHKARLYFGVLSETFFALTEADSAGTFYNNRIKKKFDSSPIDPETIFVCVPKDNTVTLRNTVDDVHAKLDAELNGLTPGWAALNDPDAFGQPVVTNPSHAWQPGQFEEYLALTDVQKNFYDAKRDERGWYHGEALSEAKRQYPDDDLTGWIVELDASGFDGWHMVLPYLGEFAFLGQALNAAMDELGIIDYEVRGVRKVG